MAQVTEFVWDEAKQAKVPVVKEGSIAALNKVDVEDPQSDNAVGSIEQLIGEANGQAEPKAKGKKRGRVAAYNPGPTAVMLGGKVPQEWVDELCAKANTQNKAQALYEALKTYLNK